MRRKEHLEPAGFERLGIDPDFRAEGPLVDPAQLATVLEALGRARKSTEAGEPREVVVSVERPEVARAKAEAFRAKAGAVVEDYEGARDG